MKAQAGITNTIIVEPMKKLNNNATVGTIGHFDDEIYKAKLVAASKRKNWKWRPLPRHWQF